MTTSESGLEAARAVVAAHGRWYHTVEVAPGVVTPGWIDMRPAVGLARLPADMTGLRALDVGSYDGFWAFEMERRGANVVALDCDVTPPPDTAEIHRPQMLEALAGEQPTTIGFDLLHQHFGSSVQQALMNVYDLSPERVGGPCDVIFMGALLLHLRDPVRALERIRATLKPTGRLILLELVDKRLSLIPRPIARFTVNNSFWDWWRPNRACLIEWVRGAGFRDIDVGGTMTIADVEGFKHTFLSVQANP